jgi:hypothetical protein
VDTWWVLQAGHLVVVGTGDVRRRTVPMLDERQRLVTTNAVDIREYAKLVLNELRQAVSGGVGGSTFWLGVAFAET